MGRCAGTAVAAPRPGARARTAGSIARSSTGRRLLDARTHAARSSGPRYAADRAASMVGPGDLRGSRGPDATRDAPLESRTDPRAHFRRSERAAVTRDRDGRGDLGYAPWPFSSQALPF